MKSQIKKRITQAGLIALVLAVLFLPSLNFDNLKAYLNQSISGSYEIEIVWGQAYSPIAGWVNFYCDGAGHTQPADVRVNYPSRGADEMSDSCDSLSYQTEYDPISKNFSGYAYSTNYGWLEMSGIKMETPINSVDSSEVTGKTNGSEMGEPYNFGKTYFEAGDPNEFNPGVRYYNQEAYFCGFAYSEEIGYISFCDPETKERAPNNISVEGYDWDTYAVYMGVSELYGGGGEGDEEGEFGGTFNPAAPTLTTAEKVLAATDDYDDTLWFMDDASDIDSVEVKIYDANGDLQTYTANYFDPVMKRASVDISNHDFSTAANYNLIYTACDQVDNCSTNYVVPEFFHVVANVPSFVSPANSYFEFTSGEVVADGTENHSVIVHLVDSFGNPVIPVSGIKSVGAEFVFDNTTDLDQIAGTGDSAIFTSSEFSLDQSGGTTVGPLSESGSDGTFEIDVSSLAPTSAGYEPIADDGIDLNFDSLNLSIAGIDGYTNIGEVEVTVASTDPNSEFAFSPAIVATPTALIWNSTTEVYEVDPEGVENITINAPKRFNISLQNQSTTVGTTDPLLGVALDNGPSSNVEWAEGVIETAGSSTSLSENLDLDIDTNTTFDSTIEDLSSWITGITASSIDNSLRFRATPELDAAATAEENLETTLQAYVCYTIAGSDVCHRGGKLEGSIDVEAANLYNPGIEILGSIRSSSGTASKQTGAAVNQSLGDTVQNEFQDAIN
ncbi:MAG: hypothetical protein K9L85_03565, partial [Candidatus Peribacteraceae bacterium]|nr:hypothetical protein [Candidatus Peribacteraceae bacterium]